MSSFFIFEFYLFQQVYKFACFRKTFFKSNFVLRLCFVKLKLLLLAVEEKTGEEEESQISINPKDFKIAPNTVGFFIAQSAEEVKRYIFLSKLKIKKMKYKWW